jgi:MFS family permease
LNGSNKAQVVSEKQRKVAALQVVLASILMVATLPGRTQGLGLVTESLLADLHLNRVTYATMNLWATVLGALLCFPAGWAIERVGLRWTTGAMALVLGLCTWQLSIVAGGATMIFLLLLATRGFGQSALSVCSIVTVGRWFPNRAGYAMGVYSVLLSLWFAFAFGLVGYSVRANGWRTAWMQIALALIFFVVPMALLGVREPRGEETADQGSAKATGRLDYTLTQALGTNAFWLFAGSAAAFNLMSSGLGLFNEAVLAERGFEQRTFHVFLAVTTLLSLIGQFLCGWLTRRHSYQTLTFFALLLYAIGLALLGAISHVWQLWCLAVLIGIAGGMIIVVFFSVWSDLFGQRQLGRIQGAAQMLTVLSSGLGPLLFAKSVEITGSYRPLLFALGGAVLILSFLVRRLEHPNQPKSEVVPRMA